MRVDRKAGENGGIYLAYARYLLKYRIIYSGFSTFFALFLVGVISAGRRGRTQRQTSKFN